MILEILSYRLSLREAVFATKQSHRQVMWEIASAKNASQ